MSDDLYRLTLADGLPVEREGKTIRYRVVHLRETNVADERAAQRAAERVMVVAGVAKLLVSEADFRYALTMRHIEAFECDGQRIGQPLVDLELLGKLSSHDLGLIEQRVFLLTLAAEVRYGNLSQADFDIYAAGGTPKAAAGNAAPQPAGQAGGVGEVAPVDQPGPALLADYAGRDTAWAAAADRV
jgi:phage FluMu protein gp41